MVASLDTEKIKPADRVSFLLNYLYLSLKNSQLVEATARKEMTILRELFISTLDSYIAIMGQWISKGELVDPHNEFFIKVNPKLKANEDELKSSREQWLKSFIFRTINLTEFEDNFLGVLNDKLSPQKVEISIPIFLREQIQDILSIGKSIKIIRFIEKEKNEGVLLRQAVSKDFHQVFKQRVAA